MNEFDPQIDAAFDTYPLVPLPARFIRRTMVHIQPRPRFRLDFLDLALPVFVLIFGITMISLTFWFLNATNPLWLLEFQVRAEWYTQNMNTLPLGLIALVGIAGISACTLTGLTLIMAMDRPGRFT
jgi:hypothetical protein